MSGKGWVVSLIERVHSTVNTEFSIHAPVSITVESALFITSRLTTNAHNILHLNNYSYGHA